MHPFNHHTISECRTFSLKWSMLNFIVFISHMNSTLTYPRKKKVLVSWHEVSFSDSFCKLAAEHKTRLNRSTVIEYLLCVEGKQSLLIRMHVTNHHIQFRKRHIYIITRKIVWIYACHIDNRQHIYSGFIA